MGEITVAQLVFWGMGLLVGFASYAAKAAIDSHKEKLNELKAEFVKVRDTYVAREDFALALADLGRKIETLTRAQSDTKIEFVRALSDLKEAVARPPRQTQEHST